MDNIYDLYRNDPAGLLSVTEKFLARLTELETQALHWAQTGQYETLHRHAHQLKPTTALYLLPELSAALAELANDTRNKPQEAEVNERIFAQCRQLAVRVPAARKQVEQTINHVA